VATLSHGGPLPQSHPQTSVKPNQLKHASAPAPVQHTSDNSPFDFFFSSMSFPVDTSTEHLNQWNQLWLIGPQHFALDVDGIVYVGQRGVDSKLSIGPKGLVGAALHDPVVKTTLVDPYTTTLFDPNLPFFSLLIRICDQNACGGSVAFTGNPWVFCLQPEQRLEARINARTRADSFDKARFILNGEFMLKPQRIDPASCKG
jgi:hypothetical protein